MNDCVPGRGRCIVAALVAAWLAGSWAWGQNGAAPESDDGRFSWQRPHAKVLPSGDLAWAPEPFTLETGDVVRYIDHDNGDDAGAGTKQDPWQHHPWDAAATGNAAAAAGPITYIFKRGVVYRGRLLADESGQPADPIRLTSDPSWGQGEAQLWGSVPVTGTWQRATAEEAPGIPEPEKVWYVDLDEDFDRDGRNAKLSSMWMLRDGKAVKLHIARDPNWTITDPNDPFTQWYRWDSFTGHSNNGWLADDRWKGADPKVFEHAMIWTQHRGLMGVPHQTSVREFDPRRGAFRFGSPGGATFRWGGNRSRPYNLRDRVAYFLENSPHFLDSAGEYYFDAAGPHKGRLYVRLPAGVEPGDVVLEAAQVRSPVEVRDQSHIVVSGLTFRFTDPDDGTYGYPWYVGQSPGVRVVGMCSNITVSHCRFIDVASAIVACPRPSGGGVQGDLRARDFGPFADDVMDRITITDNDVRNSEQISAIWIAGESQRVPDQPFAVLKNVEVLRNRVVNSGFRPGHSPTDPLPAIRVSNPVTAHIAGNFVDTSWGSGIFINAGKGSGSVNEVSLSRVIVHHNKVENTMLGCNDYGALEVFQGGPVYFFNNISRNAVGSKTFTGGELAYNLYLDGAFKVYSFNNILAGRIDPENPDYYGHCGYFMVFGFLNQFFNNTIHRFDYGINGSSGNRSAVLGNVFVDCAKTFIGQNRPGDVSMMGGGDTGAMGRKGIPTMAYARNVFYGQPEGGYRGQGHFGFVGGISSEGKGRGAEVFTGDTLEELSAALTKMNARLASIGTHTDTMPLADPTAEDYRPRPDAAALEHGVRFFVPWGLSRMVGEWSFYRSDSNPTVVLGEHFYMQDEHMIRDMYYFIPRNDLVVNQATPEDYVDGPLEDWIDGALRFDGRSRFATLTHAEMTRDMTYPVSMGDRGRLRQGGSMLYEGSRRKTLDMAANNFLLEIYFRADPGHTSGTLVSKRHGGVGYELSVDAEGAVKLDLAAAGGRGAVTGPKVNDGRWRHVIAEVDRVAGEATIYVDGKPATTGRLTLPKDGSLANPGDFHVGKGEAGFFAGAIDFLRVSRGTLADAQTSIEELHAWQFDGPFLRDFAGRRPVGRRDAGALERR